VLDTTPVKPNPKHPAKFSEPILNALDRLVRAEARNLRAADNGRYHDGPLELLDPFAGVGRIHQLHRPGKVHTYGVEIEAPWAACHSRTECADAIEYLSRPPYWQRFHVIATSGTYGNRYSDHHDARDGSTRRSYRHTLGQELQPNNSGRLPWGRQYKAFHAEAYRLMHRALRPGGLLLLNVSNFVRHQVEVPAVAWHEGALWGAEFEEAGRPYPVETRRDRFGQNHEARADHEVILRFRKPDPEDAR
jgi:hypothetical protein